MSKNWKKIKGSENPILNAIGNICGKISHIFLKPSIRWGTMWEFDLDLEEDIDKQEYTIDEVW
jgi:hypothetical protein